MYMKKEAYEAVIKRLENELAAKNSAIRHRTAGINQLTTQQAIEKRERGILCDLIYDIKKRQATENKLKEKANG